MAVLVAIPLVLVPVYRFVPPVSTLMAWKWVERRGDVQRTWVPFDQMPQVLVASVVMSEDGRYCSHWGVDFRELGKVITSPGGPDRGASTVAMQSVKNLFLWNAHSYVRKALEIPLALYADLVWGKRREMEIYLNVAELGPGIFGAEAAAQFYFRRSAAALTASEAALLTATLPDPEARNPAKPGRGLRALARSIAAKARRAGGYIDCLYP